MSIRHLHSISEITPDDCFQTKGSRPVRVFCEDFNHYVCKYFNGKGSANSLFNEYIASRFLKLWKLPVPDFAFVLVKRDHIKLKNMIDGIIKYERSKSSRIVELIFRPYRAWRMTDDLFVHWAMPFASGMGAITGLLREIGKYRLIGFSGVHLP